jgi:hypothetical protein
VEGQSRPRIRGQGRPGAGAVRRGAVRLAGDQLRSDGPISLKPIQGAGWARRGLPERLRATCNRKHGIRYIFSVLDVHRDRLYARMRPRRAGSDVLGFMRTIGLV